MGEPSSQQQEVQELPVETLEAQQTSLELVELDPGKTLRQVAAVLVED
jgi:hypothetical protein